ncbi:hypothetical protein [Mycolicibacterium rhodesiae]|uniref:Uncharacterized protein n=1 Tax=Mycolicibacterium rhodesiae TaxID=36814 RepID=A0A1X0J4W7_MYCRH|nr:hypothetical protein [Mycolicibacterium rhodesiae]MCV7345826.1 hypothetical protein [Mycolicibacterium rhodesiae]ORB57189.1 hypothetical protein BST42_01940 [Mycolicibacterium rhodesiae]
MITQHVIPLRRVRAGAALSGTALAAVLMVATPGAGIAHAHGYSTPSGDAVGRPGFGSESTPGNPAPGVRAVQALGDRVFNQNTAFNKALDDSPLGINYHNAFGTPNYEHPTHGSNGTVTGLLNGGLIQTTYDSLQTRGAALPDEADLSAAVIRQLSGHHVTVAPHRSVAATASSCTVRVAKTSLRAQGSC